MAQEEAEEIKKKEKMLEAIIETKKFESYVEYKTKDMHVCFLCETICYKKIPVKRLGNKYICINCLRALKELLENLEIWESEVRIDMEISSQIDAEIRGLKEKK